MIAEWKRDHDNGDRADETIGQSLPRPARRSCGWSRPAGTPRSLAGPTGSAPPWSCISTSSNAPRQLHLGPLLSEADRRYLGCDATCEVWFERDGQVIGAGRTTRLINRRLRRALSTADRACAVPGCGATRGLHAHRIPALGRRRGHRAGQPGAALPHHHRLHHRGVITITGPAHHLSVTDSAGRTLNPGSLARPPTRPPPAVAPCPQPPGERAHWWWYEPFQPQPHDNQLGRSPGPVITGTISKLRVGASRNSF